MKLVASLALLAALVVGCAPPDAEATHRSGVRLAANAPAGPTSFFYTAGTSGSYTVPSGAFVTSIWAHGSGSLTIAPNGLGYAVVDAGPAIPIVGVFSLARPELTGSLYELGPGTVLAFSGTDSYFVSMVQAQ